MLEVRAINKKELGNIGEEISTNYLEKCGYEVIERNYRCRQGEIDIIARDNDELVFIEVKTRSNLCFGRPREAVDGYKQNHIYKTARYYLYKNHLEKSYVRFDGIEIYLKKDKYKLKLLKNVDINY